MITASLLPLPAATLLIGGPQTCAQAVTAALRANHVADVDTRTVPVLDAATARELTRWALLAPLGPVKVAVITLDGADPQALTILLKTIEEPGDHLRLLLTASTPVLATVCSRCQVVRLPADSEPDPVCDSDRITTLAALRALFRHDSAALRLVAGQWTAVTHRLLALWCVEALTGRPRTFSASEIAEFASDRTQVRRLLRAASITASPKLVLSTMLEAA